MIDLKKILEGRRMDYDVGELRLPNGAVLRNVKVESDADQARMDSLLARVGGEAVASKTAAPARPAGPLISDLQDTHFNDMRRQGLEVRTIEDSEHTIGLFRNVVGDKPVAAITGNDCRLFLDEVAYWPPNATKNAMFDGKSVVEVIAWQKAEVARLDSEYERTGIKPKEKVSRIARNTLSKHKTRLSVFLTWLVDNHHIDKHPLTGIRLSKRGSDSQGKKQRPFASHELRAIFKPQNFATFSEKYGHRFWVPLIALFTGARINEICQLYLNDVAQEDGIWRMQVDKEQSGQKTKTEKSRRSIPFPPALLALGLLDYVEDVRASGNERLFPSLPYDKSAGYGKQMTKQFSAYMDVCGITEVGMGMHTFRRNIGTALERQGVADGRIRQLFGHEPTKDDILRGHYIGDMLLSDKLDMLTKFDPMLSLPSYTKGQFDSELRSALKNPERLARRRANRKAQTVKGAKIS